MHTTIYTDPRLNSSVAIATRLFLIYLHFLYKMAKTVEVLVVLMNFRNIYCGHVILQFVSFDNNVIFHSKRFVNILKCSFI